MYLPLLDYNLQRLGPNHEDLAKDLLAVDGLCGEIIDHVKKDQTKVIVLSEYGITEVNGPVHINRALREAGLLQVREEMGHELLDCGASEAFAVTDHQVAHIYVRSSERIPEVKDLLQTLPGVESVLDEEGKRQYCLDHPRSAELVAISSSDKWFTYYFWLDDARAPDYARTVDIHRKPGFDPVELFLDQKLQFPKLHIGKRLLQKQLGFRTLMDVIGLNATLPKGSHGRVTDRPEAGPLLISSDPNSLPMGSVPATQIKSVILQHIFG